MDYKYSLIWIHSSTRKELFNLVLLLNSYILQETNTVPIILCSSIIDKKIILSKSISNRIFCIEEIFNQFIKGFKKIEMQMTEEEKNDFIELSNYSFFQNPFIKYESSLKAGPRAQIGLNVLTEYLNIRECLTSFIENENIDLICCLNPNTTVGCSLKYISKKKGIKILFWEKGLEEKSVIIDPLGVNYGSFLAKKLSELSSSRASNIKESEEIIPKNGKKCLKLLVPLQMENDSNVKIYSSIKSNLTLLKIIKEIFKKRNDLKIIVRPHPREKISFDEKIFIKENNWTISKNTAFEYDIKSSEAVILLNSTTGFESILKNKLTIMFGNSIYSEIFSKRNIQINNQILEFKIFDPNSSHHQSLKKILIAYVSQSSLSLNKDNKNKKLLENNIQEFKNNSHNKYYFISEPSFLNNNYLSLKKKSLNKLKLYISSFYKKYFYLKKFFHYIKKRKNLKIEIDSNFPIKAFVQQSINSDGSNILYNLWKDLCKADKSRKLCHEPIHSIPELKKYIKTNKNSEVIIMGQGLLRKIIRNNINLARLSVYYTHTLLNQNDFYLLREVNHIYYLNSSVFSELVAAGIPPQKCSLFRLGVDRKLFKPILDIERDIDIIFVQSYFPKISYKLRKRFDAIVDICEFFVNKGKKVLVIGKNWNKYNRNLNFKVLDCPHKETPKILNRAKVYINLAYLEGGCVSLLEALSMDCFIISSRTGFAHDLNNGTERIITFTPDSDQSQIIELINYSLEHRLWMKKGKEILREKFLKASEFEYNCSVLYSRK